MRFLSLISLLALVHSISAQYLDGGSIRKSNPAEIIKSNLPEGSIVFDTMNQVLVISTKKGLRQLETSCYPKTSLPKIDSSYQKGNQLSLIHISEPTRPY